MMIGALAAFGCGTPTPPAAPVGGAAGAAATAAPRTATAAAALGASLASRPEGKLFEQGTRLAFGASDASPAVLLRCTVARVDDLDHWRLATVTCEPPAPGMRLVPRVAGTYAATVDGLWHFDRPPASDAALTVDTMLLPAEPYPTYLRDPVGERTWFQRTRKSGAGTNALWCSDRVTKTSYDSWCFAPGTIIQAVTVADPTGEAMYTAR